MALGVIDPGTATLIIGGINAGISALFNRKGGQQKIAASNIVNQVELELEKNRDTFLATEPKTAALKAQALFVFEDAWKQMVAVLSDPALGGAGQRGIQDRSRGGDWDWWEYYYDPIMDTNVAGFSYQEYQSGALASQIQAANAAGSGVGGMLPLLLLAGAGVGIFLLMED